MRGISNIKKMECGHHEMNKQEFNRKICGFKGRYNLSFFLMNTILQIKYSEDLYCYCHRNQKKCKICSITIDFTIINHLFVVVDSEYSYSIGYRSEEVNYFFYLICLNKVKKMVLIKYQKIEPFPYLS